MSYLFLKFYNVVEQEQSCISRYHIVLRCTVRVVVLRLKVSRLDVEASTHAHRFIHGKIGTPTPASALTWRENHCQQIGGYFSKYAVLLEALAAKAYPKYVRGAYRSNCNLHKE